MALLRALRISQNGPKGTIFEAHGNRVRQLTEGEKPIAEEVTAEQLQAEAEEKAKAETKPAAKPQKKGGPKPKNATDHDDEDL